MVDWLSGLPGWVALLAVGAVVLAEPALLVGVVLPSVASLVFLGFLTSLGVVPLWVAVVVGAGSALAGDTLAFRAGRHRTAAAPGAGGALARRADRGWARAARLYDRAGPWAVPAARWVTVARTLVPRAAAAKGLTWPRFLAFSAPSALVWTTTLVTAGHLVGASYERVTAAVGRGSGAIVLLVAMAVGVIALGRWAGRRPDVFAHAASAVRRLLPEQLTRRLPAPERRDRGAVFRRGAGLLVVTCALTAAAALVILGVGVVVRFSGLSVLDGWVVDRVSALDSPAVLGAALGIVSILRTSLVLPTLAVCAVVLWLASGRGGFRLVGAVATFIPLVLLGLVVRTLDPGVPIADPLIPGEGLFATQAFVVTAALLTAAALLSRRRSWPVQSAVLTAAALIAFFLAAARVYLGWDRPTSALTALLVGGLWALLVLALRGSIEPVPDPYLDRGAAQACPAPSEAR